MRRPFLAANWKMNKTVPEALGFLDEFLPKVQDVQDADIVLAPPFTALYSVGQRLRGTNVALSSQDIFHEEKGAFTGQISPTMLKDAGCGYAIIGHSERRQSFGDTDEFVNKKTAFALSNGLGAIMCIGETLDERNSKQTFDVLKRQLLEGLKGISPKGVVVAYEPVWAIGTGVTATPEQAQEAHHYIRGQLRDIFAGEADNTRILYGGSVTPDNVDILMACPDVDGALVGGAGLKPESFAIIVKFTRQGG